MYQLIKTDIKFALKSKKIYITMILIVIVAITNLISNTYMGDKLSLKGTFNSFLYSTLFGFNFLGYLLPFFSTMFYSWSLYKEMEYGFCKVSLTKIKSTSYLWSKLISIVLITSMMVAISFIIVFSLVYMLDPNISYRVEYVHPNSAFSAIYNKSLLQYTAIVILNYIIFSTTYAVLGCGLTIISKNYIVGSFVPSLFYIISTWFYGSIYGLDILPFATLALSNITIGDLLYDHALVFLTGLVMILIGFRKWKNERFF